MLTYKAFPFIKKTSIGPSRSEPASNSMRIWIILKQVSCMYKLFHLQAGGYICSVLTLISCISMRLYIVFLTRSDVNLAIGFVDQHSDISFTNTFRYCRKRNILLWKFSNIKSQLLKDYSTGCCWWYAKPLYRQLRQDFLENMITLFET